MSHRILDRFLRINLFLLSAFIGVASIATATPHVAAQGSDQQYLPGFAPLDPGVAITSASIGDLDPALGDPATLTVERLRIAPGDTLPATEGAQIIQIEHGALSFVDDLGLDAEIGAGSAAYFVAGSTTEITNSSGVPAIVLRTTITGQPAATNESGDSETPTAESGDTTGETGERPTPDNTTGGAALPTATAEDSEAVPEPPAVTNTIGNTRTSTEKTPVAADPSPAASPEASSAASPVATPEPTETATPAPSTAKLGVLITATLTNLPGSPQQLFATTVEVQPGAGLSLTESSGPIGIFVSGGDLTVEREGRAPGKLHQSKSVVLPSGTSAELVNDGDTPITLQIAGISGSNAVGSAPDNETAAATETATEAAATPDESLDGEPIDTTGPMRFIPSNREMEQFGVFPLPGEPVVSTDASQNLLYFTSGDEAKRSLEQYDWQNFLISGYDSKSEATDYGVVEYLAINVDTFASSDDCTRFYTFLQNDFFGGNASHSPDLGSIPGVDAEMRISRYVQDSGLDFGLMVIRSGEYTISIFVNGPDLNAIGLLESLAKLIFGPRG